eukprot:scaffold88322_cov54-Phaeocystis_antarctica.AAC.1
MDNSARKGEGLFCALLRADGQPLLLPVQQVARRRAGSQHRLPAMHAPGGLQSRGRAGGATAKGEDVG